MERKIQIENRKKITELESEAEGLKFEGENFRKQNLL